MDRRMSDLTDIYELVLLEEGHIPALFQWEQEEQHREYFTCRPVPHYNSYEEFEVGMLPKNTSGIKKNHLLVRKDAPTIPLGRITLFDINPRNRSAEFGYCMPESSRGKGLGSIMLTKFLSASFLDQTLTLHKVYATTSAGNLPSMKLLEKFGFHLDGRNREHYWIEGYKYDQMIYSLLRREWEANTEKN